MCGGGWWGFPLAQLVESACNAGDLASIPGLGRSPGEGNGTHSSLLAWRIPWTEEPGGLLVHRLQKLDLASTPPPPNTVGRGNVSDVWGEEGGPWILVTSQERKQGATHHHERTQEMLCMALLVKKHTHTKRMTINRTDDEMKMV